MVLLGLTKPSSDGHYLQKKIQAQPENTGLAPLHSPSSPLTTFFSTH